jgi:hypothetical protein
MATLKLGKPPANFAPFDVSFTAPDGELTTIPKVVYKYRTRREYAEFVDRIADTQTWAPEAGEKFSVKRLLDSIGEKNVEAMAECIVSWGIEESPSVETFSQLLNESPAAFTSLWAAYGNAARDGRLGN